MAPLSSPPPVQPATRLDASELEMLETRRILALASYRRRMVLSVPALGLVAFVCAYFFARPGDAFWHSPHFYILTIFAVGGLYHWVSDVRKEYAADFKDIVLPHVAAAFGLRYKMIGGVPLSKVMDAAIIPPHTRIHTEDLFFGNYKGSEIYVSELDLWYKRQGLNKEERECEVFSGLAMVIALPRVAFEHQTVVLSQRMVLSSWLQGQLRGLEHVDLVDPYFEKKYRAYGKNQVETRFLLHPAMVERIERLNHAMVSGNISVVFLNGAVLVLIQIRQNLFEPPSLSIPATDVDSIRMLEHELQQALGLVDAFEFYRPQG